MRSFETASQGRASEAVLAAGSLLTCEQSIAQMHINIHVNFDVKQKSNLLL
jgi:hypothetical protein